MREIIKNIEPTGYGYKSNWSVVDFERANLDREIARFKHREHAVEFCAAPELLAHLEATTEALHAFLSDPNATKCKMTNVPFCLDAYKSAKALIAKAKQ